MGDDQGARHHTRSIMSGVKNQGWGMESVFNTGKIRMNNRA